MLSPVQKAVKKFQRSRTKANVDKYQEDQEQQMIAMNGYTNDRRRMTEVSNQMSAKGNGMGPTPSSSKFEIHSKIF